MKLKISELKDATLAYAVGLSANVENMVVGGFGPLAGPTYYWPSTHGRKFTTNALLPRIMNELNCSVARVAQEGAEPEWTATIDHPTWKATATGPSADIAIFRCFVKAKFGDEIEVPERLLNSAEQKKKADEYNATPSPGLWFALASMPGIVGTLFFVGFLRTSDPIALLFGFLFYTLVAGMLYGGYKGNWPRK